MFGLGKKKDPLDDLHFPSDSSLGNLNPGDLQQNNSLGDPSSIPNTDPLSSNFLDDSSMSQPAQNMDVSSNSPSFHPSEFNSVSPDSVVPTSPIPVADPIMSQPVAAAAIPESSNPHQMELISSKLDVLKAMMENLSQRISSLESKLDLEKDRQRKTW